MTNKERKAKAYGGLLGAEVVVKQGGKNPGRAFSIKEKVLLFFICMGLKNRMPTHFWAEDDNPKDQ
jgi:hypothetical protein